MRCRSLTLCSLVVSLSLLAFPVFNGAQARDAWAYARLGAYMTQAGALKTFSDGNIVDPYFGMYALLLAKRYGLNDNFAANRFIGWVLRTQRPDGRFNKYCYKANAWSPCGDSDSEDTTLARWVDLLYTQARDNGRTTLPRLWKVSAQRALHALADQQLPSGVYSVFPATKPGYAGYALFKDNVETYNSFKHIAYIESHWGHAAKAKRFDLKAHALKLAMLKAFGSHAFHLKRLALGATYTSVQFYPQVVAPSFSWLEGFFNGTRADWNHWLFLHRAQWFANAKVDYPWGILALEALNVGDKQTAACWLEHSARYRVSNTHWDILEEISAQAIELQTRGIRCSRP